MKLKNLKRNFQNLRKLRGGKNTQSSNATVKTDILGDQLNTQTLKSTEQLLFVQSISRLQLIDFIDCCVNSIFSSLVLIGNASEKEIENCWISLLSQFYKTRKDESNNEKNEIIFKMQELKLRASIITMLLNSIGMIYSETLIKTLKDFDNEFNQFEFSEGSVENDLQLVKNMEINNEIQYRQLKDDLERLEKQMKDKEGNTVVTGEQVFYDYVASYNEVFKTSLSVESISTMTYANNCHRLDEYFKQVESDKATTN